MTTSYAVIGSGFRAFCNCMHLSQAGAQEIYMIDPAKSFGGVMNSEKLVISSLIMVFICLTLFQLS